jgi:hypothetical protein
MLVFRSTASTLAPLAILSNTKLSRPFSIVNPLQYSLVRPLGVSSLCDVSNTQKDPPSFGWCLPNHWLRSLRLVPKSKGMYGIDDAVFATVVAPSLRRTDHSTDLVSSLLLAMSVKCQTRRLALLRRKSPAALCGWQRSCAVVRLGCFGSFA